MASGTGEEGTNVADSIVTKYATYEQYLDCQITPTDLYYLEDEELARQLVELGYRGSGEVIKRDEFEARKEAAALSKLSSRDQKTELCHVGKSLKGSVFLEALAEREEANRSGRMTTIIFIRDINSKGQEISGYIDYAYRLKMENFEPYFLGRKKLHPRHTDLSFYNWDANVCTSNSTTNYEVIADSSTGLLFKNRRDRKIINVDPKAHSPGDNTTRVALSNTRYIQVVLYDHVTRKKA